MSRPMRLSRLESKVRTHDAAASTPKELALGLQGLYLALNHGNWAPDNVAQLCGMGLTEAEAEAYVAKLEDKVSLVPHHKSQSCDCP